MSDTFERARNAHLAARRSVSQCETVNNDSLLRFADAITLSLLSIAESLNRIAPADLKDVFPLEHPALNSERDQ